MNKIQQARHKWKDFSARGSKCPVCRKDFRYGCRHSISEAKERLFEDYIRAILSEAATKQKSKMMNKCEHPLDTLTD